MKNYYFFNSNKQKFKKISSKQKMLIYKEYIWVFGKIFLEKLNN